MNTQSTAQRGAHVMTLAHWLKPSLENAVKAHRAAMDAQANPKLVAALARAVRDLTAALSCTERLADKVSRKLEESITERKAA